MKSSLEDMFEATKLSHAIVYFIPCHTNFPILWPVLQNTIQQTSLALKCSITGWDLNKHLNMKPDILGEQAHYSICQPVYTATWDFQQCGMCNQQRIRSACQYAQSYQSLCWTLEFSMNVKLLTEHHLEALSSKGGCTGSPESTLVKMPHSWKSHVTAHIMANQGSNILLIVPENICH